jgi:hypothetical protein
VDLHHLPEGTHSLAPRPDSLVRLTFHLNRPRPPPPRNRTRHFENEDENDDGKELQNWSAWQDSPFSKARDVGMNSLCLLAVIEILDLSELDCGEHPTQQARDPIIGGIRSCEKFRLELRSAIGSGRRAVCCECG